MMYTLDQIVVRRFMECLFKKQVGDMENWEDMYTQYIDTSGQGEQGQLGLLVSIHNLDCRLKHITDWLELQSKVLELTGQGYEPKYPDMQQYGYRVAGEIKDWLFRIETKEKRNVVEKRRLEKELSNMQKTVNPKTVNARNSFVTMLNVVGKGHYIDRDKVDMESVALMIFSHLEQKKEMEAHGK